MHLQNTLQPSIEPLTLDEAKLHCRIDISADDDLVTALITKARRFVENYIISSLITQNWTVTYDYCDVNWYSGTRNFIRLPMKPIQSITTITTFDMYNNATIFNPSNYRLSGNDRIVLNDFCYWSNSLRQFDCLQIDFIAGYGDDQSDVPLDIVQAMELLIAQWYENREAISDPIVIKDKAGGDLSYSVTALLSQYRTLII